MKLLFKSVLLVFIFSLFNSDINAQKPDDVNILSLHGLHSYSDGTNDVKGCYTVSYEGVKPYYCVGEDIDIDIVLSWDPDCTSSNNCSYATSFFLNGDKTFITDTSPSKQSETYRFDRFLGKGNHKLTFVLIKTCGSASAVKIYEEINVVVLEPGEPYIVEEGSVEVPSEKNCQEYYDDIDYRDKYGVCCGQSGEISATITIEESSTESNSYTVGVGASLGLSMGSIKINNLANINESLVIGSSSSTNYSGSFSKSFSYSSDDKCVFPIPKFIVHRIKLVEYIADCDNDPSNDHSTGWYDFIDIPAKKIEFYECYYDRPVDCKGKPNLFFEYNFDFNLFSGCSGLLTASFDSEYDSNGLLFSWTSPNGTNYGTKDINFSELGLYSLVITDRCCNEYEYTVNVCKETITTDWELDEATGDYCRTVTCQGDETKSNLRFSDCAGSIYEECVTPDNIISEYENGDCIDKYFYLEELLGKQIYQSDIQINYNNETGECNEIVYCNNSQISNRTEMATYGTFWTYNNGDKTCSRVIFCFGDEMEDMYDVEPADIDYDYNLNSTLCDPTVNCNQQPIFAPSFFPFLSGNWTWSEFDGCSKDVQCVIDGETLSVEGNESFYNWSFNDFTNQCEADVRCQDQEVFGVKHTKFPSNTGQWEYDTSRPSGQKCRRVINCEFGAQVYDYTPLTFTPKYCPCDVGSQSAVYYYCSTTLVDEDDCIPPEDCLNEEDGSSNRNQIQEENILIEIYPNPAKTRIHLIANADVEGMKVKFYDVTGRKVFESIVIRGSVSLSDRINPGLYILKITKEDVIVGTSKVVISK